MKREIKTLKQIIDSFKEGTKVVREDILPDYKSMTWEEKLKLVDSGRIYIKSYLVKKENRLIFFQNQKEFHRIGNKIFPLILDTRNITISNNRIYNNSYDSISRLFLETLGFKNLIKDFHYSFNYYLNKPIIIKDILTGRIYNEETLVKRIISDVYHIKSSTINWKSFKILIKHQYDRKIYDIVAFTKNYYNSINILAEALNKIDIGDPFPNSCKIALLFNVLSCACSLNEKVDFAWSNKRLSAEHRRQIETLNKLEIENKKCNPIHENIIDTNNIKLLNTEKDIFLEGKTMHHCLYRCYFNECKNKTYLAFHMNDPEDCTFGLKLMSNNIVLDQAYLKYDKPIKQDTKNIILKFVEDNQETLKKMFSVKNHICRFNNYDN